MATYAKGLAEIGDGVHAYLQPDGGWGWSNAGIVCADGASLLIDTLFDLPLTREMLAAMRPWTRTAPITTVVNTHANGDHCYGNELVAGPGVEIIASRSAAREMDEMPPSALAALMSMTSSVSAPLASFLTRAFGAFSFEGVEPPAPTRTFDGTLACEVAGRRVDLIEVGPAHTAGDVIVWLPDERIVFTGDIVFVDGTPILWAGPVANWLAACERIAALDAAVIVPGHGPLTDRAGVEAVARYLAYVERAVRERHRDGLSANEATLDIFDEVRSSEFGSWGDPERLAINVETVWCALDPTHHRAGILEIFERMARLG